METRGRRGDPDPPRKTAAVSTDTGSLQIVELGTVGPRRGGVRMGALVAVVIVALASMVGLLALAKPAPAPISTQAPTGPVTAATLTPTPAPSPAATPTPRPAATQKPAPGPWVWDAYELQGFSELTSPVQIWAFANRFVVLISTALNGDESNPNHSLLISTDGSSWARAVLPAPGFEVERGIVLDGELWLIGPAYSDGDRAREAWATTNGTTWNRSPTLEQMLDGVEDVLALARGPAGWVALCSTIREPDAAPVIEVRRELPEGGWDAVDLPLDMHERAADLVGRGSDLVLLVEHTSDEGDGWFDLLHSSDGEVWSLVKALRPGAEIMSMTVGAGGFVIVGEESREDGTRPIAWQSEFGEVWEEGTMPVGVLPAGLSAVGAYRVVATDTGYLAISEPNGMAWVSTNGLQWSAFNIWPTVNDFMVDIAVDDDRVVAIRASNGGLGFLRGRLSGMR